MPLAAGRSSFATTLPISAGERNWPFFTFTARPVAAAATQQVGLAAEEGGDLEHVGDLRGGLGLPGLVDVGDHRDADSLLDRGEDRRALPPAPGPRADAPDERLALSNEDLKTRPTPWRAQMAVTSPRSGA